MYVAEHIYMSNANSDAYNKHFSFHTQEGTYIYWKKEESVHTVTTPNANSVNTDEYKHNNSIHIILGTWVFLSSYWKYTEEWRENYRCANKMSNDESNWGYTAKQRATSCDNLDFWWRITVRCRYCRSDICEQCEHRASFEHRTSIIWAYRTRIMSMSQRMNFWPYPTYVSIIYSMWALSRSSIENYSIDNCLEQTEDFIDLNNWRVKGVVMFQCNVLFYRDEL